MINIEAKENVLYLDKVKVKKFPYKIIYHDVFKNKILILLDYKESENNNLFCLDFKGKLKWQVSSNSDYENEECPITSIEIRGNELIIFRWCCYTEKINFDNGELLESIFTK
ncbi:MAG: hypothetical protein ACI8ZM_005005 [Crocinitomix sp.]|jgi:hypothetical protein